LTGAAVILATTLLRGSGPGNLNSCVRRWSGLSLLGGMVVAWRAGARLLREMWPLIQAYVPEDEFRAEFVRGLLRFFVGERWEKGVKGVIQDSFFDGSPQKNSE